MSMVKLEVRDFVAVATMDSAPVNSQPMQFMQGLTDVFDTLNDGEDVRVAFLTGEGKTFSVGVDVKHPPDFSGCGTRSRRNRIVREVTASSMDNNKPTIAAVNGRALGAGLVSR